MRVQALLALLLVIGALSGARAAADERGQVLRPELAPGSHQDFFDRVAPLIVEGYEFSGLASYYNGLSFFVIEADELIESEDGQKLSLKPGDWFIAKGRFNVLALRWPGAAIEISGQRFSIQQLPPSGDTTVVIVSKPLLGGVAPELDQLRYSHLWWPIAALTRLVEWALEFIHGLGVANWGMVIIVFSVLLKILLVPLGFLSVRYQRQVSQVTTELAPQLAEIKSQYVGEEAHNRIMAAHKALGVSTLYTLKPMMITLVQVPILIAIFNALGEMPQFTAAGFLWIEDLAYPDSIWSLPGSLMLLGGELSLLPLLMTAVTVLSTITFKNPHALPAEMKTQRRNLMLMATAFLILFYPFPAATVLYWALANILQTLQQQFTKL